MTSLRLSPMTAYPFSASMRDAVQSGVQYAQSIWRLRHFWGSLVYMDLAARYRKSFLGIGWSLVRPIAMTAVLTIIFSHIFGKAPYEFAPFILVGLTVWQFLTESILGGCHTFTRSAAYIRQMPLPLAIFPLRTVLAAGFHALISLSIAIVFCWALFGFVNVPALPTLLPTLIITFLLAWALSTIAAMAHTYFQDTQHMLEIVLQIMFYLTPIMYPASLLEAHFLGKWLLALNPVYYIIEALRQPIIHATAPAPIAFLATISTLIVAFVAARQSLRWLDKTLAFWV